MISDKQIHIRFRRNRLAACLAAAVVALLLSPGVFPEAALAQGRPIKATMVQGIDFGIIGATNITGDATIRSDGTKVVSAGILDLGGVSTPAVFLIQGERLRAFTITLPVSATITLPGGPSAVLSNFESGPAFSGILDNSGRATVAVGATMNLTPSLWEGAYGSFFDISVTYQ